jgi:dolichol-phosphate mannosyltransferase
LTGLEAILGAIVILQIILAARVLARLGATAGGSRVDVAEAREADRVTVLLPVLNEAARIERCLESLIAQTEEVAEILVIDGGSTDGTQAIVDRFSGRDPRVRLVDASPVPRDWTGKAWNLNVGLERASADSEWILCVDADVRLEPLLSRSLLAHARKIGVSAFSVATRQRLSGPLEALVHPALLTTLVYRFGIPGGVSRSPARVQANGQCFIARRLLLRQTEAFRAAKASLCEDITIARRIAEGGEALGFYEAGGMAEASMYSGWRDAWRNWPRSLPMRDQYFGRAEVLGLLEVLFAQALPLPFLFFLAGLGAPPWSVWPNAALVLSRLGVLAGVSRAYVERPLTYWLSPLMDLPAAVRIIESALRRSHSWRGRVYTRGKGGRFDVVERRR